MHNLFSVYFIKPLHVSGVTTAHHQEAYRQPPDDGPWLRLKHVEILRNILKINFASSWFFFTLIYQDAWSTKHKMQISVLVLLEKPQFNKHFCVTMWDPITTEWTM